MQIAPRWRLPKLAVPALVLLALAAALLWLSSDSIQAQNGQTVPSDWEHIPDGVKPGDSFRLLFVTSTTTKAESSDIADYNKFVQTRAAVDSNLADFSGQFRALISTASVNIKDNTGTTGAGVPIHWLGGDKVADDYADLYDGDWDSASGKTETDSSYTGLVWTGGSRTGGTSGQRYAGASQVRMGDLSDVTLALSSPNAKASGESYPLYALSPVITVAQPTPTPTPTPEPEQPAESESGPPVITAGPTITSAPAGVDTYGGGETIVVSVTFSEAVTATGDVRVRLAVSERQRWARYSSGDGATLTFAYSIKGNDRDEDGVSIGANQVLLRGGSIVDADGNAVSLEHSALPDQSGHKVDGSRKSAPAEQQQPASNSAPQFASETATLSVNEDAAVGANVGGAITATDSDNDILIYTLTGSDAFTIDASGQITVAAALDHETKSSYSLTASVTDGVNAAGEIDPVMDDTIAVTVTVGNVDEPGAIILNSPTDPPEADGTLTASLTDPDGGFSAQTWSWQRSLDGATWETVAGATAATYTLAGEDGAHYLRATASYTDAHGPGKTAVSAAIGPVTVTVPVQQPQAQAQTVTVTETVTGFSYTESVRCEAATDTGTRCWVPHDWPLIPTVNGERLKSTLDSPKSFRLMFVTSTHRDATDNTVAPYNTFVQNRADRNTLLKPFKDHFRAMVQPWQAADHMKPNTKTRSGDMGASDPIYWLNGVKVADNYADLYDNSWDHNAAREWSSDEFGADITSTTRRVWTGSKRDGTNLASHQVGNANPVFGLVNVGNRELGAASASGNTAPNSNLYSLYTMSPVLTVDLAPETPPDAPAGQTVAPNWALTPAGLGHGDSFRLIFVTSTRDRAGSTDIGVYNRRVQERANANANLQPFKDHFRALISTAATNARDNTATIGAGVPIYWVGGDKMSDDYADFYDGSWPSATAFRNESGATFSLNRSAWTGSRFDGAKAGANVAGSAEVRTGNPASLMNGIDLGSSGNAAKTVRHHLYGLSPVFTVNDPAGTSPAAPSYPYITVQVNERDDHLVTWSTPPGSGPAHAWKVQWAPKGAGTWNDLGAFGAGGATHTGNSARQARFYRVKAIGLGGESDWSAVEPTRRPDKPQGLRAVAKDGAVTLYWDDPNDPSMAENGDYYFTTGRGYDDGDWSQNDPGDNDTGDWAPLRAGDTSGTVDFDPREQCIPPPPDFDYVNYDHDLIKSLCALKNGKQYRIHIRAVNSKGVSNPATIIATPNTDDKTPAYVKKVEITSMPASGDTYHRGEVVEGTVTFSRPVTVDSAGNPLIKLSPDFDLSPTYSRDLSGGWENITRLIMDVDVREADSVPQGLSVPQACIEGAIKYNDGGTMEDAILDCPATGPQSNHKVNSSPVKTATVEDIAIVSTPDGGSYRPGDEIIVRLTMTTPVVASTMPKPTLTIRVGSQDRQVDCVAADTRRDGVDCAYTVRPGDADADGVSVAANALSLPSGASLEAYIDGTAPAPVLDHPALPDDPDHKVDTTLRATTSDGTSTGTPLVSAGWRFTPDGLKPGDSFRLLFLTKTLRQPDATDIASYNTFVQNAANNSPALGHIKAQVKALGSTGTVDARDNTGTTGTGVPIYWLDGEKVADNYADFYDGNWDSTAAKDETGAENAQSIVWTGSEQDGTKDTAYLGASGGARAGSTTGGNPISNTSFTPSNNGALYALSPVIKVRDWYKPRLTVTGSGHGKVTLTWTNPHESFVTSWYYKQTEESSGATTSGKIPGSDANTRSYTITGLEMNKNYVFQVYAARCDDTTDTDCFPASGLRGFRSNEERFHTWRLAAAPTNVKPVYPEDSDTAIIVTWTPPAVRGQVGNQAGVSGYQIEHSTDEGDTWQIVGTVSGRDATMCKHTPQSSGSGHLYVVKSVNAAGPSVSSARGDPYYAPWERSPTITDSSAITSCSGM